MGVLPDVIDRFEAMELLVVGEAMLDAYLHGAAERLSQEAPVPVVSVGARRNVPGAAANVAANAAAFGARPALVSVIGDDEAGAALRAALDAHGVPDAGLVVEGGRRTLAKNRVVSGSQLLVRFDEGDVAEPGADAEAAILAEVERAWGSAGAVVVSDYGYGVLGDRMLSLLARLQAEAPRVLVVDSKRLRRYRAVGVTAVKPNYEQAVALVGAGGDEAPKDAIALYAEEILERTGARIAAITLDRDGALVLERGRALYRTYARPRTDTRATGAGDTFATALALALAAGAETPAAAELASAAANIVVAKDGDRKSVV